MNVANPLHTIRCNCPVVFGLDNKVVTLSSLSRVLKEDLESKLDNYEIPKNIKRWKIQALNC